MKVTNVSSSLGCSLRFYLFFVFSLNGSCNRTFIFTASGSLSSPAFLLHLNTNLQLHLNHVPTIVILLLLLQPLKSIWTVFPPTLGHPSISTPSAPTLPHPQPHHLHFILYCLCMLTHLHFYLNCLFLHPKLHFHL